MMIGYDEFDGHLSSRSASGFTISTLLVDYESPPSFLGWSSQGCLTKTNDKSQAIEDFRKHDRGLNHRYLATRGSNHMRCFGSEP